MLPRGADAVVMVEHTEVVVDRTARARSRSAARSRPARTSATPAPTSRAARPCCAPGRCSTSREIGVLAAIGVAQIRGVPPAARGHPLDRRRDRARPASRCAPGAVYDSNAAIIGAAVDELGGEPVQLGVVRDDEDALDRGARTRRCEHDVVLLSGGTSKGAGDLSYRVVEPTRRPGHRRARRRAQARQADLPGGEPTASRWSILPGFPTSAIFTFHEFVAPVIRAFAGLPPERRQTVDRDAADARQLRARPHRVPAGRPRAGRRRTRAPIPWARARARSRPSAAPTASSPSTSTPRSSTPAPRSRCSCSARGLEPADLVIIGSHCVGLDCDRGTADPRRASEPRCSTWAAWAALAAAQRGECDIAGVHLMDPATGAYNRHLLTDDAWR